MGTEKYPKHQHRRLILITSIRSHAADAVFGRQGGWETSVVMPNMNITHDTSGVLVQTNNKGIIKTAREGF